jgi:hypothetical protein
MKFSGKFKGKLVLFLCVAAFFSPVLWAQNAATGNDEEEIAEEDDPANWAPGAGTEVAVKSESVKIRSYRTRAKATVVREYMPMTDEARMLYVCQTNVFDEGDARMAIVDEVNKFIKENRERDFYHRGNPHTIKPYYHYRVIAQPTLHYVHDEDAKKQLTKYTMFIQFYN